MEPREVVSRTGKKYTHTDADSLRGITNPEAVLDIIFAETVEIINEVRYLVGINDKLYVIWQQYVKEIRHANTEFLVELVTSGDGFGSKILKEVCCLPDDFDHAAAIPNDILIL
jgi:hypothetical protein